MRAIVSEFFAEDVYLDPARLFGSPEALTATVEELPLYADQADISSCPPDCQAGRVAAERMRCTIARVPSLVRCTPSDAK